MGPAHGQACGLTPARPCGFGTSPRGVGAGSGRAARGPEGPSGLAQPCRRTQHRGVQPGPQLSSGVPQGWGRGPGAVPPPGVSGQPGLGPGAKRPAQPERPDAAPPPPGCAVLPQAVGFQSEQQGLHPAPRRISTQTAAWAQRPISALGPPSPGGSRHGPGAEVPGREILPRGVVVTTLHLEP